MHIISRYSTRLIPAPLTRDPRVSPRTRYIRGSIKNLFPSGRPAISFSWDNGETPSEITRLAFGKFRGQGLDGWLRWSFVENHHVGGRWSGFLVKSLPVIRHEMRRDFRRHSAGGRGRENARCATRPMRKKASATRGHACSPPVLVLFAARFCLRFMSYGTRIEQAWPQGCHRRYKEYPRGPE